MHPPQRQSPCRPRERAITTTICAPSGAIPQPADSADHRRPASRQRRRATGSRPLRVHPLRATRRNRIRSARILRVRILRARIRRATNHSASRAPTSVPERRLDSQIASSRAGYSNRRPTTESRRIGRGNNPSVSRGAELRVSIRSIPTVVLRSTDPKRFVPSDPCGVDCGRSTVDSWPGCHGRYTESAMIRPSPGSTRKNGFSSRIA